MTTPIEHPPITLQAQAGQAIDITLDAMPGAGLQWQLPAAPSGCTLTEAAARPGDSGSGVGGGSRQHFVLTCSGTGEHLLTFEHRRPWEAVVRARQPVRVQVR